MSPKVPTCWPPIVAPSASQQSSISHRPCLSAISLIAHGVERVAERVGRHDGARARRDRCLDRLGREIIGGDVHIHEDGSHAPHHARVDRSGKASGRRDDLGPGWDGAIAKGRGGQGREGHQVRGRAGVDGEQVTGADALGESLLKAIVEAAGRQPELQRGLHQRLDVARVEHAARHGHSAGAGHERFLGVGDGVVFFDQRHDLRLDGRRVARA